MKVRFFGAADLAAYEAVGDPLLPFLNRPGTDDLVSERWLRESVARRMLAWTVYGDLLTSQGRRIVDVGGGHSSLTRHLRERHHYRVVELGAHDVAPDGTGDWRDDPLDGELVIAFDLFPNVDQGLARFLRQCPPVERRLLLTTYPDQSYRVRRIGADELLTVCAWTWPQTRAVLGVGIEAAPGSLFPNGRQVCLATWERE